MTDAAKPAWLGITVYLVTCSDVADTWFVSYSMDEAEEDFAHANDIGEPAPRIWECQMGQTPVDVTPKETS